MKQDHRKKQPVTRKWRWFPVLWTLAFVLLIGRIVFDAGTYFFGSSFVVPGRTCHYIVHLPRGFGDWDKPRPLLIYLHGSGETKKSVRSLRNNDLVTFMGDTVSPDDFPFIVVSPKTDTGPWNPDRLVDLLDELLDDQESRWKIDPTRIYLTGFSMGGFGTWETGMKYPDRFAAIIPVAGGYREYDPEGLKDLPVWAFHGERDDVVPVFYSEELIASLEECRGRSDRTRLTIFDDCGHTIPKTVYRNRDLYRWLLKYKIGESGRVF